MAATHMPGGRAQAPQPQSFAQPQHAATAPSVAQGYPQGYQSPAYAAAAQIPQQPPRQTPAQPAPPAAASYGAAPQARLSEAQAAFYAQPQPQPQPQFQPAAAAPQPVRDGDTLGPSQIIGALLSLALLCVVIFWGYKLVMRDVSGIPVVQATEGPMRVAPENPGGQQADHQGLAVNEVAGRGAAAGPAEQLILAPTPVELTTDDAPNPELALTQPAPLPQETAQAAQTAPSAAAPAAPLDASIQALADQIASGVTPLVEIAPAEAPAAPVQTAVAPATQAAPVPGGARSLRPTARPASLTTNVVPTSPTAPEASATRDVDAASLPAGTRLVQLGAYDSADVARSEWDRISGRFDAYFASKGRVIQRAQSGGKTFYRLRAHGFDDLGEARRFCAALVAGRTDCIPVVTR